MDMFLATEDALGDAVGNRLIAEASGGLKVAVRMGLKGNVYLRQKLPELIKLAKAYPVLLLTDLDRIECPPQLIQDWTGAHALPENMLFRVVVREVESWLLADRNAFSAFSGVPLNKLPTDPESVDDAKALLLRLVRRYGHKVLKQDLLPASGTRAKVGFGYNQQLCQFVNDRWSPVRASGASDSLSRVRNRLAELAVSATSA